MRRNNRAVESYKTCPTAALFEQSTPLSEYEQALDAFVRICTVEEKNSKQREEHYRLFVFLVTKAYEKNPD